MRLGELAAVKTWLPNHPLASDPLWARKPASLSENDIQLFYARAGVAGKRRDAIDAIDRLQAAVIAASFNGELPEPPGALIMHEPPEDPFLVDELVDGLVKLRPARRRAALFALETGFSAADTICLSWERAISLQQLSGLAREILTCSGKMRHFKLPYVFWEWATPTIAAPLLELQWSVETAFGCTWPQLVQKYRRMTYLNRGADSASLLELADHFN